MNICFEGIRRMAYRAIKLRKGLGDARGCIDAYHDSILGLVNGDCSMEELKDFFFNGKSDEQIKAIPYTGMINFKKKSPTHESKHESEGV